MRRDFIARHAPFALSLIYGMHFSSQELVERSIREMQRVASPSAQQLAQYRAALARIFPDVDQGDRVTAIRTQDGRTVFYFNARLAGTVNDPSFAPAFFGIWLSPETSEPAMRANLLGHAR